MSINYSQTTLKIAYKGKTKDIITSSLLDIDELTRHCISKFDLLSTLIKSGKIKDKSIVNYLIDIKDDMRESYPIDEECRYFNFAITTKGVSNISIPVVYSQSSFDYKDIANELINNNKLNNILSMYLKNIETDPKNKMILYEILKNTNLLDCDNIKDDMRMYYALKEMLDNGYMLNEQDFIYLKEMKKISFDYDKLRKNISKLTSNIDNSLYKKHMLLSIVKLFNNTQTEENEIILYNSSKKYNDIQNTLEELTLKPKEKKYEKFNY